MTDAHRQQSFSKRQFLTELGIVALVLVVVAGCLGGAAYYVLVVRAQIAPGDVILVKVAGHPDLSGEARVGDDGLVRVREIGMVPVSGLSVEKAGRLIAELLGGVTRTEMDVRVEIKKS
jgi:protein involved in polysaccharide export with SLBB domain